MTELKQCPFCGSFAQIFENDVSRKGYPYYVLCDSCGAKSVSCDSKNRAISIWNTRIKEIQQEFSKESIIAMLDIETNECLEWIVDSYPIILGASICTIARKNKEDEEGISLIIKTSDYGDSTETIFSLSDLKKMIKCIKTGV